MRFPFPLAGLVLIVPALASFDRMVVRNGRTSNHLLLNNALLDVAVPVADYEKMTGLQLSDRRLQEEGDDFEVAGEDGSYTFTGYSMKYAKCQPVQYFSDDAIKAGEFSPMRTQDIVILRLCPQKSCSSSEAYGCHYNYAEYALTLSEYTTVMLKYAAYQRDSVCEWCAACIEDDGQRRTRRQLNQRVLEENVNDDANAAGADNANQGADGDDAGQPANGDDAAQNDAANEQQNQDAAAAGDDAADVEVDDKFVYEGTCQDFNTYCSDYTSQCQDDDDAYLDLEGYLDYMDCTEVQYNNYAYYVKPRCDGSSGAIKMAVYYDKYCTQAAGNDVNIKNFKLGFKDGVLEKFYSTECIDCSESEDPPFYNANSLLCNKLHSHSAKCDQEMLYDLFESEDDSSTECSYIDSLRSGAYDQYGQFSSKAGGGSSWDASVTTAQAAILGVSVAMCILFIISACYLHHSMTNLLLKSLSHRELLPRKGRSRSRTSREGSGKRSSKSGEPDWEGPTIA